MLTQYLKFAVNGGLLGVAALVLQSLIYKALGGNSPVDYGLASTITYMPLVIVNFAIQRKWIFKQPGLFWRFVAANLSIMLLVSLLSPLCRHLIDGAVGSPWGDRGGFAMAALLGSVPSFMLKRIWVFGIRTL